MEASLCLLSWERRGHMERTGDTDGRPQRWCLKGRHRISTRSRSGDLTVSPCPSVQVGVCLTVGSAGLDPNPSSEVFVICNDPGLCLLTSLSQSLIGKKRITITSLQDGFNRCEKSCSAQKRCTMCNISFYVLHCEIM